MRSTRARFTMILVGVVLAGAALLASSSRANAQVCNQPTVGGCPLPTGQAQRAVLDPDEAHFWWLVVPARSDLLIELTTFVNYRLYLYGPDGGPPGAPKPDSTTWS